MTDDILDDALELAEHSASILRSALTTPAKPVKETTMTDDAEDTHGGFHPDPGGHPTGGRAALVARLRLGGPNAAEVADEAADLLESDGRALAAKAAMPGEFAELKRLAEYAGPDRWVEVWEGWVLKDRDDIAFINAANPATVLRLLSAFSPPLPPPALLQPLYAAPPPSGRGGRATARFPAQATWEMVEVAYAVWKMGGFQNTREHIEAALNAALGSAVEGEKTEGDLPDGVGPVEAGADR